MLESLDYDAGQGHFSTGLNGQDSISSYDCCVVHASLWESRECVLCERLKEKKQKQTYRRKPPVLISGMLGE